MVAAAAAAAGYLPGGQGRAAVSQSAERRRRGATLSLIPRVSLLVDMSSALIPAYVPLHDECDAAASD